MSFIFQKVMKVSRWYNSIAKCLNFKNVFEHNVHPLICLHQNHNFEIIDDMKQNMNKRFCGQWFHQPYKCLYKRQSHESCKKPKFRFFQFAFSTQVGFFLKVLRLLLSSVLTFHFISRKRCTNKVVRCRSLSEDQTCATNYQKTEQSDVLHILV